MVRPKINLRFTILPYQLNVLLRFDSNQKLELLNNHIKKLAYETTSSSAFCA